MSGRGKGLGNGTKYEELICECGEVDCTFDPENYRCEGECNSPDCESECNYHKMAMKLYIIEHNELVKKYSKED